MGSMHILILAIGDKLPAWAEAAVDDFTRRMPREYRLQVVGLRPEKRAGQPVERVREREAARLLERCPAGARLLVLDERGRQPDTRELAQALKDWALDGRDVVLVLGGADGLDPDLVAHAESVLSLSRLTLPHALARVVLVEQLYRAWSLLAGHPYHRD